MKNVFPRLLSIGLFFLSASGAHAISPEGLVCQLYMTASPGTPVSVKFSPEKGSFEGPKNVFLVEGIIRNTALKRGDVGFRIDFYKSDVPEIESDSIVFTFESRTHVEHLMEAIVYAEELKMFAGVKITIIEQINKTSRSEPLPKPNEAPKAEFETLLAEAFAFFKEWDRPGVTPEGSLAFFKDAVLGRQFQTHPRTYLKLLASRERFGDNKTVDDVLRFFDHLQTQKRLEMVREVAVAQTAFEEVVQQVDVFLLKNYSALTLPEIVIAREFIIDEVIGDSFFQLSQKYFLRRWREEVSKRKATVFPEGVGLDFLESVDIGGGLDKLAEQAKVAKIKPKKQGESLSGTWPKPSGGR